MTDLLTPDQVREIDKGKGGWQHSVGWVYSHETVGRLCRDYLTQCETLDECEKLLREGLVLSAEADKIIKRKTQDVKELEENNKLLIDLMKGWGP